MRSKYSINSTENQNISSAIPLVQMTPLTELPEEIKECLENLQNDKNDEDWLYENADQIAEWFTDSPDEYQKTIAAYVQQLFHSSSPIGLRILLSAFCDAEVTINDETLLGIVAGFLKSTDKQLAQAAASCLLLCGKSLGRSILERSLMEDKDLPHANLIQGIIDELLEDIEDLRIIAERQDEETISHEDLVAELEQDGLL